MQLSKAAFTNTVGGGGENQENFPRYFEIPPPANSKTLQLPLQTHNTFQIPPKKNNKQTTKQKIQILGCPALVCYVCVRRLSRSGCHFTLVDNVLGALRYKHVCLGSLLLKVGLYPYWRGSHRYHQTTQVVEAVGSTPDLLAPIATRC